MHQMNMPFSLLERAGAASVRRLVTVQPRMCGPAQALVACVGDWTWETVSIVCGLDVFNARDSRGMPVYLAFYYYRITSGARLHPEQLTFGDRLEVLSQVFNAGKRSILTVHRLRRVNGESPDIVPFEAAEIWTQPREDCIYVENLNVWVSRGEQHTNVGLLRTPPVGFTEEHLPNLPESCSSRLLCATARREHSFPAQALPAWPPSPCPEVLTDHPVNPAHDVNGVGLLYFASFFAIAEGTRLHRWRTLGRSNASFLDRSTQDARICYLGNADVNSTLRVRLRTSHHPDDPMLEKSDLVVSDLHTGRTIAIASFRHQHAPSHQGQQTCTSI